MAQAEQTQTYDAQTPVTAHEGLAAAQFAEHFATVEGPVLNVAAGGTDLHGDLLQHGRDVEVVSLDPSYNEMTVDRVKGRVQGLAQEIPYEDEAFALSICQFGLQHMDENGAAQAVREMVRVTKTADDITDTTKGVILAGPIFKKGQKALIAGVAAEFADVAGVEFPPHDIKAKEALPTLIIKKTPRLTQEKLEALIGLMQETGAFKPTRRTLGEMASRAFGGYSSR